MLPGPPVARFLAKWCGPRLVGTLAAAGCLTVISASPAAMRPIAKPRWLAHVTVTEYFPYPEAWSSGRRVAAPGLAGRHRVDWLYSAQGMSMEGDGVALDGRRYHIDSLGEGGWVNRRGRRTRPRRAKVGWSRGAPFWRNGGFWKAADGTVTFPLDGGGWAFGRGVKDVGPPAGISFAPGPSLPLRYWKSLAVDPRLIPKGSRIYIPAYRAVNGGWFRADDTGGAVLGRHLDVYRPAPAGPGQGSYLTDQRVFVEPPQARRR